MEYEPLSVRFDSTSVRRAIRSEFLRWNETMAVCPGII